MPLVSIVIPAYNAEAYLAGALRSALRQTYADLEVLVVDDGSSDGTPEVARHFAGEVRYLRQENAGPGAARNTGILHACGEYISFLDADDEMRPERTAVLVDALRGASPAAAFAISDSMVWDGTRFYSPLLVSRPYPGERDLTAFLDEARPGTWILTRRQTLMDAGGFRTDLWRNEDYHLWLRLLRGGHTYAYVPEPLYLYRFRPDSLSRARGEQCAAACQVHEEALNTLPLSWGQRRRLLYMLWRDRARLHFLDAAEARGRGNRRAWAQEAAAGLACQSVRTLIRPHFTATRAWYHLRGRG